MASPGTSMSAAGIVHSNRKHVDNSIAAFNKRADLIGPHRQRRSDLALVTASIVDAGDAALVAALVVQNLLDDVRCTPRSASGSRPFGEYRARRKAATAVAERLVELGLARRPTTRSPSARAPNRWSRCAMCGTAWMISHAAGGSGSVCSRLFLAALARNRPRAAFGIQLAPAHAADFLPPAPGQDQQSHDAAVIVVVAGAPDSRQFGVG